MARNEIRLLVSVVGVEVDFVVHVVVPQTKWLTCPSGMRQQAGSCLTFCMQHGVSISHRAVNY